MARIIIIGGGLTGLSTAYHLEQHGFFDYKLFEKEHTVGGLCRSVQQDGFTFDYTGHLLHAKDPYFYSFIEKLVGLHNLNSIYRRSFIFSENTYTKYPYQINLHGLSAETITDCIEGYANRPKTAKKPSSFREWVLQHFGKGIAEHFFFPFQEKIFSYDLHKVSPTWMGRFVPKTSLRQMIQGALHDSNDATIGYNAHFFYPQYGGINFWINKLAHAIQQPIYTNKTIQKIDLTKKTISFTDASDEPFDILINTMPLDECITRLKEPNSTTFYKALPHLICNSVINLNVGVKREHLSDKHWIYFPEKKYPFYRVGFPHNFANSMTPKGCSSLYAEFSHIKQPLRVIAEYVRETRQQLLNLFSLQKSDIATEKIITIPHAYVIYTSWREKHLSQILTHLEEHQLYSIGRYGAWKYSSMQEAVLDGKEIAHRIITAHNITTQYQAPSRSKPKVLRS